MITEPAYTVVFGFVLDGRRRCVVARVSLEDDSCGLAQDAHGRIPVFKDDVAARRWAAATFPLPAQAEGDEIPMADLVRGMEDLYARAADGTYDLDAVKRWAADPLSRAANPRQVLDAWVFLHWAGVAPGVDLDDLAGHPDARGVAGLARLLGMMSRKDPDAAWPDEPGIWGAEENGFLAEMLQTAIDNFSRKIRSP